MDNNLIFVSAQPDELYFHWQCKIYVHNFIEMGIPPKNIHILFSIQENSSPSEESLKLKEYGVNVHHYVDDRPSKIYLPSIGPRILGKWLYDFPNFKKLYFYHDSDIVFRKLPNFELLSYDNLIYLSDTKDYIGYERLKKYCLYYNLTKYGLKEDLLIDLMVNSINIDKNLIQINDSNCGGAQHLMKNIGFEFWEKVYNDSEVLYQVVENFYKKYEVFLGGINSWLSGMWALIWNLWNFGYDTKITDELSFSWASQTLEEYNKKNILHIAGVYEHLKGSMFFKGEFKNVSPFEKLKKNKNYFNYIQKNNSTIKYVEIMKDIIEKESNMYLL
jgi:hypothetical protein